MSVRTRPKRFPLFPEVVQLARDWGHHVQVSLPAQLLEAARFQHETELVLGRTAFLPYELVLTPRSHEHRKAGILHRTDSGEGQVRVPCGYFFFKNFFRNSERSVLTPTTAKVRMLQNGQRAILLWWPELVTYSQLLKKRESSGERWHLEVPIFE